jgi:hypothetical protein
LQALTKTEQNKHNKQKENKMKLALKITDTEYEILKELKFLVFSSSYKTRRVLGSGGVTVDLLDVNEFRKHFKYLINCYYLSPEDFIAKSGVSRQILRNELRGEEIYISLKTMLSKLDKAIMKLWKDGFILVSSNV